MNTAGTATILEYQNLPEMESTIPFQIGNRLIGHNYRPFIIAEMSGNHNQSLEHALDIVEAAARSGADALKLQTYTPETITLDIRRGDFVIDDETSLWKGNTLFELYFKAHTPWEWHQSIFERARDLGMLCFSTPFDETAVDFLENLNVPAYKIASFEIVHLPLVQRVAATGKPIILSTGMASVAEIDDAIRAIRDISSSPFALLKCTSSYPASIENSNISTISHMRSLFKCEVGLSDHTEGIGAAIASVACGGSIIEKHITLRREDGGVDSVFSIEPEELTILVKEAENAWRAIGDVTYGPSEEELRSMVFRRSVYVSADIKAGEELASDNIRCVRPGMGLSPKYYKNLLGKRVNRDLARGSRVTWDIIN